MKMAVMQYVDMWLNLVAMTTVGWVPLLHMRVMDAAPEWAWATLVLGGTVIGLSNFAGFARGVYVGLNEKRGRADA